MQSRFLACLLLTEMLGPTISWSVYKVEKYSS